jgi:hypothetical protein
MSTLAVVALGVALVLAWVRVCGAVYCWADNRLEVGR